MYLNKMVVWILTILCLVQLGTSDRISPILIQSFSFPPESNVRVGQNTKGDALIYAECPIVPEALRNKHCSISIQSNSLGLDKSCNATLMATKKNTVVKDRLAVYQLSSKKALLVWIEADERLDDLYFNRNENTKFWLKFTTVHLDECRTRQAEISINGTNTYPDRFFFSFSLVLNNDDTFDVVYADWKLCKDKFCRVTFDAEGRQIKGPVAWLPLSQLTVLQVPVTAQSAGNGHLVLMQNGSLDLINDNGSKELKKFSELQGGIVPSYSNAHDLFTFCMHDFNVQLSNCTQLDKTGKINLDVNIPLDVDYFPYGIHNLQNGEFLLVSLKCNPGQPCHNARHYVRKIGTDGKPTGERIEISGFECKLEHVFGTAKSKLYENGSGEQCLTLMCLENMHMTFGSDEKKFSVARKCFSNKNFLY